MQISQILQSKGSRVVAIEPEMKIREVTNALKRERIGAALVRDRDGALVGIVSERDIVHAIADDGPAALDKSAADLMSRALITCRPDSSTAELMERMLAERIRHLPVCEDDRLLGIVSIGDVVKSMLAELKWRDEALQQQLVTAVAWSTDED